MAFVFVLDGLSFAFNGFAHAQDRAGQEGPVQGESEAGDEGESLDFEAGKCDEEANSAITYGEWVELSHGHHHDHAPHHHHH